MSFIRRQISRSALFCLQTRKTSMNREEALKTLIETAPEGDTLERLERLEKKLDLILSAIVIQQKDACEMVGITSDTIRNKVLRGETEVLQRDGSRLNYLTLENAGDLKVRRRLKRRK